jgi:hypothetical protein
MLCGPANIFRDTSSCIFNQSWCSADVGHFDLQHCGRCTAYVSTC